jgi:membrane fusion protein (multidrug efflux system)
MLSRTAIFVALPVAGLVALGAYAYYSNRAPGPLQGSAEGQAEKGAAPNPGAKGPGGSPAGIVVAVETAPVKTVRLQDDVAALGTLRSSESVVVRPEISGRIAEIGFTEGSRIHKGQLLIALDSSVYAAELQQARANLALAETNFKRTTDLEREKFVSANATTSRKARISSRSRIFLR